MDPHASMTDLGDKRRRYAQKLAEAGFSDDGRDIPMARLLALAPTTAEAEAIARRGAQWLVDAYAGPQHATRRRCKRRATTTARSRCSTMSTASSCMVRRHLLSNRSGELKEEIGLNYLMCAPLSRETFRLLADEVLPRL